MTSETSVKIKHDPSETYCICQDNIKASTLLVGFPGMGLVGTIAVKHLIKELELKVVGYIKSPLIPPLAVFLDGVLAYPYRIHASEDSDIAILIGESPAPTGAYYYLANAVLDWAESIETDKNKEVICLDGFVDNRAESQVYMVAEPDLKSKLDNLNLARPQTGFIGGLSGSILNESIIRPIDGYALLVSTLSQFPDPAGAAKLIEVLNKQKNLEVNVESLLKDGEKIKASMAEFASRTQQLADRTGGTDTSSFYT